jgi:hypothetical protein
MGMIAFYAGLILGVLVGMMLMVLWSKVIINGGVSALPQAGEGCSANTLEL